MSSNDEIILVVPFSHTHYVVPPIGLGYLATALRHSGFLNVSIVDCLKEKIKLKQLVKKITARRPRVVGFQVFSYDMGFVARAVSLLRRSSPGLAIVLGGPHASAVGADILHEIPDADYAFVGEGEPGLPMLMRSLLRGEKITLAGIPGLVYRGKDGIQANPRAVITDLDQLGFPAWDLLAPGEYPDSPQGGFYRNFPIAPLSTSRGCPYSCTFCGSGVNMGKKLRLRSIPHVLQEMEMLVHQYGVREFHVIDDMFNFYKERVLAFCQGILDRKLAVSFTFPNGIRLNQLDMETLAAMKKAGAYAFNVGIESGSQRTLERMKKDLTLEMIEEKIEMIVKAGLDPCGFFIVGFPGESAADIRATMDFAKKLPLRRAHFSNFLPLPGTEATSRLLAEKEICLPAWKDLFYSRVPYAPPGISRRRLKSLQRRAYIGFHWRPRILIPMISDIRSWNHLRLTLSRIRDYLFRY